MKKRIIKSPTKVDTRPSTEEWYQTVLKVKAFCEEHEIPLDDTSYGWLATLFHELKSAPKDI